MGFHGRRLTGKQAIVNRRVASRRSGLFHIIPMNDHADRMPDGEHPVGATAGCRVRRSLSRRRFGSVCPESARRRLRK